MRAVERIGWKDLAEILNLDVPAVRKKYLRAVARLRETVKLEYSHQPDWGVVRSALEFSAATVAESQHELTLTPSQWRVDSTLTICDTRVLEHLANNPADLLKLTSREFEEFVAGLLERFGYSVSLGPVGADGGVDIHGTSHSPTGHEYIVVQCKRYAHEYKVPLPLVKQLRMDALDRGANRGLLVTTSWFTRDALSYVSLHKYQLSAVDSHALMSWMRRFV